MPLEMSLEKVRLFTIFTLKVLLSSMNINVSFEKLSHEELLPTSLNFTDKFRLRMIVEMSSEVVEA
jgi:hypothetical protein